jgi:hypothetical protein
LSGRFYTDRLTYVEESRKKKYYSMAWKTVSRRNPTQDGNYSSSKVVKSLIKKWTWLFYKENIWCLFNKK